MTDGRIGGNHGVKEKCHKGTLKLLQKIQGICNITIWHTAVERLTAMRTVLIMQFSLSTGVPAVIELIQLELAVAYNTLVFSLNLSSLSDVQQSLTYTLLRGM